MAADIYTLFRTFIGDETPDYSMADSTILHFLDAGIDKASQMLSYIITEDMTITDDDISNGYIDLSHEIIGVISNDLWVGVASGVWDSALGPYGENVYWQVAGGKRIRFINTDYISAGDYTFTYKAKYKKFDGEVRDNDYFDFPKDIDIGIVYWALALYQATKGVTNVDNETIIMSRAEDGMSQSFDNSAAKRLSGPKELKREAVDIFINSSNHQNINFSVTA